ncbi:ENR1 protein, partial [Machaerirhynchus nigripectus]|nr:ENR1 protein [Machaerirhynchus nigripectus]
SEQLYQCWESSNPYAAAPSISKYWVSISTTVMDFWEAPTDLFWICGSKAYSRLPSHWRGSCTLGAIQPGFFLLSKEAKEYLGVPL